MFIKFQEGHYAQILRVFTIKRCSKLLKFAKFIKTSRGQYFGSIIESGSNQKSQSGSDPEGP